MSQGLRCSLLVGLWLALAAPAALGAELVVGGYGLDAADDPSVAAGGQAAFGQEGASATIFDFTPRGSALIAAGEPRTRFELNIASGATPPEALAEGQPRASWLADEQAPLPGTLSIGGALQLSEWTLGGGVSRTALFGGTADLVSASVGYGPLSATLAYGETLRPDQKPLDVLMLSTDMAAWSWLTLESNLALGSDGEAESVAVGRLGVRLNF